MRQHDGTDHCHQQDQSGAFEQEQVAGIEQRADIIDIAAPGDRFGSNTRSAQFQRTGAVCADAQHDFREQHERDQHPEREMADEAGAKFGKIDVEHHHHEQKQHRDRADIDDHQQRGDELRAHQHHQPGTVEESNYQPQHRMDGVAAGDHQHGAGNQQHREQVKGEGLDHGPRVVCGAR